MSTPESSDSIKRKLRRQEIERFAEEQGGSCRDLDPEWEKVKSAIGSLSKELKIDGDVFSTGLSWESHS